MVALYHATRFCRVPAIKREGLVLGKRRLWKNAFGVALGSTSHLHFFTERDQAICWGGKMEWEFRHCADQRVAILEIDGSGIETTPDPHPEAQLWGTWVRTSVPVPASKITTIQPLTLEMKREAIQRTNERLRARAA